MKKFALWFTLGIVLIVGVGAVVTQTHNLYILNSDDDEIKIKIRAAASQTAPFLEFVKGGTNVFTVAADGTITPALLVAGSLQSGLWVTTNDSRAITNLAGDLTLQAGSTFLQMNATGGGTGYKYFDFYNGGSTFNLRRKSDNGGTVLDSVFAVASTGIAFGVPVTANSLELPQLASIPTNAIPPSTAAITNWVLINLTNAGPVFIATNRLAAGTFLQLLPTTTLSLLSP